MIWGLAIAAVAFPLAWYLWLGRPRRPAEPGFPYVHVNLDGTARELSPGERNWVTAEYSPGDGARPAFMHCYRSKDGWGIRSGLLARRRLPRDVVAQPVHPEYDARCAELERTMDPMDEFRRGGDIVTEQGPGQFTTQPDPNVPRRERWRRMVDARRETMRRHERLAAPEPRPTQTSGS